MNFHRLKGIVMNQVHQILLCAFLVTAREIRQAFQTRCAAHHNGFSEQST